MIAVLFFVQRQYTEEDVSFRRIGHYASVEEVLTTCQDVLGVLCKFVTRRVKNSTIRLVVAFALCHYAGCTQRATAEVLGLSSGVAVSIQPFSQRNCISGLSQIRHCKLS